MGNLNHERRTKKPYAIEQEIHSVNDKHYTIRISPYRTTDNSVKSLTIIIIDSLNGEKTDI